MDELKEEVKEEVTESPKEEATETPKEEVKTEKSIDELFSIVSDMQEDLKILLERLSKVEGKDVDKNDDGVIEKTEAVSEGIQTPTKEEIESFLRF